MIGTAFFYGFGTIFKPVIEDFGWSNAQVSLAFSLRSEVGGIAAPVVGIMIDRWGPRRSLLAARDDYYQRERFGEVFAQVRRAPDHLTARLAALPGVAEVFDPRAQVQRGLAHPRSGELVAVAQENAWFTYYYWLDDARAPDFARCVDIHRKPGYDPVSISR